METLNCGFDTDEGYQVSFVMRTTHPSKPKQNKQNMVTRSLRVSSYLLSRRLI